MMLKISKYSNWFILVETPLINSRLTFSFLGDELEDYPDSPGTTPHLTGEAARQLLDTDNSTMEAASASQRDQPLRGHPTQQCRSVPAAYLL
jgi:hypothetical protein